MIGQLPLPGVLGTIGIYAMAASFAMATACWSMGVALRARTVQAAPMMQLVVFILVFTSVAYAPRDLQTGWLRTVSDWNPVTRILEFARTRRVPDDDVGGPVGRARVDRRPDGCVRARSRSTGCRGSATNSAHRSGRGGRDGRPDPHRGR